MPFDWVDESPVSPKTITAETPWPVRLCAGPVASDGVNYKTTKQGWEHGGGREKKKESHKNNILKLSTQKYASTPEFQNTGKKGHPIKSTIGT